MPTDPNAKVVKPITINEARLTSTNVTDSTTEWTPGGSFDTGETCKVTTTANGAASATNKIYTSQTDSNSGNDPTTDTVNWEETSSTNDWKMFDTVPQDQSSRADNISVVVTPGVVANSFALINVQATEAVVSITSAQGGGTVYSETHSLIDASQITNWYEFFFEPITYVTDYTYTGLPTYSDCVITFTLNQTGGTALCGALIFGTYADLGWTQHGSAYGLIDYSTISIDSSGRFTINEGNYSKRANASIYCETRVWSSVQKVFHELRNTPAVWIGDENVPGTIIYGFYREYIINIDNPELTRIELTITGLTAT